MKTQILTLAGILLLILFSSANAQEQIGRNTVSRQDPVTITCTPELYELTLNLVSEFNLLNPGVNVKIISNAADKHLALGLGESLRFVSTKSQVATANEKTWEITVGRDVIVPIFNAGNPFMGEITKKGVSPEMLSQIINNPDKQNWGTLLGRTQNNTVPVYMSNDETIKAGVENFLQQIQMPVNRISVRTNEEVVSAIQKDKFAMGFCNLVDILNEDNQGIIENIRILPVDKNGNGTIDYMENIYSDLSTFMRGVWIGKYPKALYSNIYAVSKVKPASETEIAFLSWVLTDGQQLMNKNGFCDLTGSESQSQLAKFNTVDVYSKPEEKSSNAGLILSIVAGLIAAGVIASAVVSRYRKQASIVPDFNDSISGFEESAVKVPCGLYFDRSHTWAFMEKDGNISIGIDDFLQHITGPITRVEMKNPGEKIKKGELLFSIIQFGKQLSLYSPVSGTIKKQNDALMADASKMNSSPYAEGWVYMIEPSNWFKEIQFMEMAEKYKKWINTEFSRIKDFLAATLKPESLEYSHVVLQDGGVLKEGILADFGPEVWEDFQTNFLDNYK
ncbi:MAG: substrate-binding domain-containing protein [Bacteroidota bacterium]